MCIERSSIGWELEELEQAAHLVAAEDTTQHDDVSCESTCSSGGDSCRSDTRLATSENSSEATRNTVASKLNLKSEPQCATGGNLRYVVCKDPEPACWLNTALENEAISIHEPSPKVAHDPPPNDCTGTAGSDTTPLLHDSLCDDGVGDLTDNFKCLLTLQPHLHPTQKLIEELH